MKKILTALTIILAFTLVLMPVFAATTNPFDGKTIIIDAGHGGGDPGTMECSFITEADANLDIARILEQKLTDAGATVVMTRTEYTQTLSNSDRYTLANSSNGDALISVHLNGSLDYTKNGTLGLYSLKKKDLEYTKVIHSVLAEQLGVEDLGVTNFMSGVTLKSDMPASIQESVYLSNTDECSIMGAKGIVSERKTEIAQALFEGLEKWFVLTADSGDSGDDEEPGDDWIPPGQAKKQR